MLLSFRLLLLCAASSFLFAQAPAPKPVFSKLTPPQMREMVKAIAPDLVEAPADGNQAFTFKLGAYKVVLFAKPNDLQLFQKFSDKVDIAKVNDWNRTHRFSRVYLDTDGGACLEADLDFAGGVTSDTVHEFIKTYGEMVGLWSEFVAKNALPAK